MAEIVKQHKPFVASPEHTVIRARLMDVTTGESVSYVEIGNAIAPELGDIRKTAWRHVLASVRHSLENEGIWFDAERDIGLIRLNDQGKLALSEAKRRHVRSTTRKALKALSSVEKFADLSNDDKIQYNAQMSLMGVLAHIARATTMQKTLKIVSATQDGILPVAQQLEYLKKM